MYRTSYALLASFILSGLMLTSVASCQQNKKNETKNNLSNSVKEDSLIVFNMKFVGDVMGHLPQVVSAYNPSTKSYNYDHCFSFIKPIIEDADMAVCNLEVSLPGKGPYSGYPMFRSPDNLAYALKNAGFDLIFTANNHSNDGRLQGVIHTLDVLDSLRLLHSGTFRNQQEKDKTYPLIFEKKQNDKSLKLAFLNYTYDTNGVPTSAPSIVNLIDSNEIKKDIALAKTHKPDMIIVFIHWGQEYQLKENANQQQLAHMMWDQGADLVVGMHPHVVQPIRKSSRNRPDGTKHPVYCAYSLGNFISNQQQPNTDVGLLFNVQLVKNINSNQTTIGQNSYMPLWRLIKNKKYYTLPVDDMEKNKNLRDSILNQTEFLKMQKATQKIRTVLKTGDSNEKTQ